MYTTFSPQSVWQLIAEDWTEKKRLFGYGLFILLGILILVAVYWGLNPTEYYKNYNGNSAEQTVRVFREHNLSAYYIMGLLIFGALTSLAFNSLKNIHARATWLMRPGTYFEKMVAIFLMYGVLFLVAYIVLAVGVFKIATLVVEKVTMKGSLGHSYEQQELVWKDLPSLSVVTSIYFGVQAFFTLGVFYFKKLPFIKTVLVLSIVVFGTTIGLQSLGHFFGNNARFLVTELQTDPFDSQSYASSDLIGYGFSFYEVYQLPDVLKQSLIFLAKYGWTPFFWLAVWFRLQENEIE